MIVKNAQLSTGGAETAAGIGGGEGSPEQEDPVQGERWSGADGGSLTFFRARGQWHPGTQTQPGADGGHPTSVCARASNSRSVDPAVVRDVTLAPHDAIADDGASSPNARQAISPQARESRSFPEPTR